MQTHFDILLLILLLYFSLLSKNTHKACLNCTIRSCPCRFHIICRYFPLITAVSLSQKHRLFCTSNPTSTNNSHTHTDTHCQLIQRGDQSEAPFQHTLRGRVVKQSTVCIICTASHFSFFFFYWCISVSHLPDSPSQGVYRGGWKAGSIYF